MRIRFSKLTKHYNPKPGVGIESKGRSIVTFLKHV
jgi:hypothetical protein